ncbi:uncharacterized protein CIMG_12879 [Coccidioides immitis RS]|uniref:Uncharacterized protein n=1 Tax=Coccidioides immitis (strain RS) TaxID=246410 RepID=A0A0D8JSR3_COCIM|nr:uncharacterized protein CIMG_12879 [Coccidioides immitis RS]KJF60327.1 hypothetical protein CIMG_12879 [Coccidioides immitis RS]
MKASFLVTYPAEICNLQGTSPVPPPEASPYRILQPTSSSEPRGKNECPWKLEKSEPSWDFEPIKALWRHISTPYSDCSVIQLHKDCGAGNMRLQLTHEGSVEGTRIGSRMLNATSSGTSRILMRGKKSRAQFISSAKRKLDATVSAFCMGYGFVREQDPSRWEAVGKYYMIDLLKSGKPFLANGHLIV